MQIHTVTLQTTIQFIEVIYIYLFRKLPLYNGDDLYYGVRIMVFNATLNNISVISYDLLVILHMFMFVTKCENN